MSNTVFHSLAPQTDEPFVFGVDLDNTTAAYLPGLWRWLCAERGEDAPYVPLDNYNDMSPWGLTFDEFREAHQRAVDGGLFLALDPMPGAVQVLNDLAADGVRIKIVTARFFMPGQHRRVCADTADWLDRPGRVGLPTMEDGVRRSIPYSDLCFTNRKQAVTCDAYIDDSPGVIEQLRQVMDPNAVIVFDQPHNRHVPGPRVTSWSQVPDVLASVRERSAAA